MSEILHSTFHQWLVSEFYTWNCISVGTWNSTLETVYWKVSEILHATFHQWLVSEVLHLKLNIGWYLKFYTRYRLAVGVRITIGNSTLETIKWLVSEVLWLMCLLISVRNSTLIFSSVVGVRSSTLETVYPLVREILHSNLSIDRCQKFYTQLFISGWCQKFYTSSGWCQKIISNCYTQNCPSVAVWKIINP